MSDRDILWEILELRHDDSVTKDDIMAMIREHLEEKSRNAEQVNPKDCRVCRKPIGGADYVTACDGAGSRWHAQCYPGDVVTQDGVEEK